MQTNFSNVHFVEIRELCWEGNHWPSMSRCQGRTLDTALDTNCCRSANTTYNRPITLFKQVASTAASEIEQGAWYCHRISFSNNTTLILSGKVQSQNPPMIELFTILTDADRETALDKTAWMSVFSFRCCANAYGIAAFSWTKRGKATS